jgi:glutathione synthase/RimK-type ligase-like ATP-grasp enzyme
MIPTHRVLESELAALDRTLHYAPCIFQERIQKRAELRVMIVGNEIFAAKINLNSERAQNEDIHICTDKDELSMQPFKLEKQDKERVLTLMKELKLEFAGIDFVINNKGELVFLEVNPTGDWIFVENQTALAITQSVCERIEKSAIIF